MCYNGAIFMEMEVFVMKKPRTGAVVLLVILGIIIVGVALYITWKNNLPVYIDPIIPMPVYPITL